MKKISLFLFLVLAIPYYGQTDQPPEQNLAGFLPKFFYDALNYMGSEKGKTRVDIYIEVPFIGIQFLKSDEGFTANYSITLSFFDESKQNLISEKTWSESVNSKTFEGTVNKASYYVSVKSFDLQPKTYFLRCEVTDKDSKKSYVRENVFIVKSFSPSLDISDVLLVSKTRMVNDQEQMIPNISKNVSAQKDGLTIYYELYADTAKEAILNFSILGEKSDSVFKKVERQTLNSGKNSIKYTIRNSEMGMGIYDLAIAVKDNSGKVVAQTSKKFFSKWTGLPSAVKDLDKAIDQMVYIAKSSELKYIREPEKSEEKSKRFVEFWQKKDPTPSTEENEVFEEYFRRVSYANEHFKHYQEGWKTDMGMVYITLGPPNNVERHPFEFDTKPYEIWDYYDINKRFIFVDESGFGDYRLTSQPYGNWWKYKQ